MIALMSIWEGNIDGGKGHDIIRSLLEDEKRLDRRDWNIAEVFCDTSCVCVCVCVHACVCVHVSMCVLKSL